MARMQWSKLRKGVEALFADSVRGRVGLYSTRYRTTHDEDGRAWITIDGRQIVSMPFIWVHLHERDERAGRIAREAGEQDPLAARFGTPDTVDAASIELMNEEKYMQPDLGGAMHDYLSLSMQQVLKSENPIIRALGMLDRRLGSRRLTLLSLENEHPLVRELGAFRRRADAEWRAPREVTDARQLPPN
jgi:hypothetical protein